MYELRLIRDYASILKDGKPIAVLSGLYVANERDIRDLKELIRWANIGLETKGDS